MSIHMFVYHIYRVHYVWILSQDGEGALKDIPVKEEIGNRAEDPKLGEL